MIAKLNAIGKIIRTVSHLKPIQVAYQLKNRFTKTALLPVYYQDYKATYTHLSFTELPKGNAVLKVDGTDYQFTFLNQQYSFSEKNDWTEVSYGRLWNYNLQYLDFLRQPEISLTVKQKLLNDIYSWIEFGRLNLEPYPASLRIMNIIRFLNQHNKIDELLLKRVFGEVKYLSQHPEYHLLGNHLLENGFALLMGGYFFNHLTWIKNAEKLLVKELDEQILADGGHFELSPMYHQIILFRVLEAVDYLPDESSVKLLCQLKAKQMVVWLRKMTYSNGDIPHFNDSANGIAFSSHELFNFGEKLGLGEVNASFKLGESGYRKFNFKLYECVVDAAPIGPSYQPGHGHSDALSFNLHFNQHPLLVEVGTSTYNEGSDRNLERSTRAHNTVEINGKNQSEVYGAFRVGRRANVKINNEDRTNLSVSHDGYMATEGITHERHFQFRENKVTITDLLHGKTPSEAIASFHLHPDVKMVAEENQVILENGVILEFSGHSAIQPETYLYALGFNKTVPAVVMRVHFFKYLETVINFESS